MRQCLTDEQRDFARSLDAMLTASDTPSAVRAWAAGDPAAGRALWARLAEAGVFALAVPEAYEGGLGVLPLEVALAFVELGRHAVPGPVVETVAVAALLDRLGDGAAKRFLPPLAAGELTATLAMSAASHTPGPGSPTGRMDAYALDADTAGLVLVVAGDELRVAPGHGPVRVSADPARRLARPALGGEVIAAGPHVAEAARYAARWAALATAAQALGAGYALLDRTVAYVKQRTQFGAAIGSFQAVKHRLADTLLALEFARPLLYGAAVSLRTSEVAAAKVAAGEAAYGAARTALQLHGAVGYTEELDLALWLRKARPLRDAWGTPAWCREQVLAEPHG
ncbi:acyl-CoA dehydrogenase [Streptomyces sp. CB03234]|uniref:acyl-CoA dehydrogenase family protein n=1 Tax=Streptomyces sp. (strain CB03234) TaxID=1703937 RepID=UPI00093AE102|nr:acyl-CoA dehydrogenase family protein [Streptomyces sp. CB03234]OKK08419.1 acyl-CoA dehydrogenase [Streptomyces sp. CB03234]